MAKKTKEDDLASLLAESLNKQAKDQKVQLTGMLGSVFNSGLVPNGMGGMVPDIAAMNAAVVASTPRGGLENTGIANNLGSGKKYNVSKVAKKVHRELRQDKERQTKKKLGSNYNAYKDEIYAIIANIKLQLQARNVRNPSRPIRTFQNSFEVTDDTGYVDMGELTESLHDFDVKLDPDDLQILTSYLDLEMNNKFVSSFF